MNTKKLIYFISFLCVFSLLCINKSFSAEERSEQVLLEKLEKVEHSKWEEKEKVLKEIRHEKLELSVVEKALLIDIFEEESYFQEKYVKKLRKQGFSINEAYDKFYQEYGKKGYVRYFSDFATLISSFKDTRTIPFLLKGLRYYGGAVLPTHIITIGEKAVEPLLVLLDSKDRLLETTIFFVLSVWVNAPIIGEDYSIDENMSIRDAKLLDKIKVFFLKALHDESTAVRSSAVFGLGAFPEDIVMRELEDVLNNDPYSYYSKYEDKVKHPIREDAKRTIEKLKAKMKK